MARASEILKRLEAVARNDVKVHTVVNGTVRIDVEYAPGSGQTYWYLNGTTVRREVAEHALDKIRNKSR